MSDLDLTEETMPKRLNKNTKLRKMKKDFGQKKSEDALVGNATEDIKMKMYDPSAGPYPSTRNMPPLNKEQFRKFYNSVTADIGVVNEEENKEYYKNII